MTRSVTVLGATGSVGTQTVELLAADPARFRVRALVGGRNAALLARQARALGAEWAVIGDEAAGGMLEAALAGSGVRVAAGRQAVIEAAGLPADWTMAAITGGGRRRRWRRQGGGAGGGAGQQQARWSALHGCRGAVSAHGATLMQFRRSRAQRLPAAVVDGTREAIDRIRRSPGGPSAGDGDRMARAGLKGASTRWSMGAEDLDRQRDHDEQGWSDRWRGC